MIKPVLLIVAGPNGAGKTTITRRLRTESRWSDGAEYINPDDIAQQRFGGWDSLDAVRQAADWAGARREELLAARQSIAFETVFSTDDRSTSSRALATPVTSRACSSSAPARPPSTPHASPPA